MADNLNSTSFFQNMEEPEPERPQRTPKADSTSATVNGVIRLLEVIKASQDEAVLKESEPITEEILIPPDGGWGWVICIAAFVSNFLIDGLLYCCGQFKSAIEQSHPNIDHVVVSWIFSLITAFYQLVGPFVGILCSKISFRVAAMIGGALGATVLGFGGLVCYYVPNNIPILYLMGILIGSAMGFVSVPAVIAVSFYFKRRRALASSIALAGTGVGSFVMQPVGKVLLENLGWELAFSVSGGIFSVCVIAALAYRPVKLVPIRVPRAAAAPPAEIPVAAEEDQPLKTERTWSWPWSVLAPPLPTPAQRLSVVSNFSGPPPVQGIVIAETDQFELRMVESAPQEDLQQPPLGETGDIASPTSTILRTGSTSNRASDDMESGGPAMVRVASQAGVVLVGNPEDVKKPIFHEDIFNVYNTDSSAMTKDQTPPPPAPAVEVTAPETSTEDRRISEPPQPSTVQPATEIQIVIDHKDPKKKEQILTLKFVERFDVIRKLFGCSLFGDKKFQLVVAANCTFALVIMTPYLNIQDVIPELNFDKEVSGQYLMTLGVINTITRLGVGFLADLPWVNPIILAFANSLTCAVSLILVPFIEEPWQLCALGAVTGMSLAVFTCMKSIMLAELFGIEKLTNAFGLLSLVYGFGLLIGLPFGATLRSAHSAGAVFIFSGCSSILTALILLATYLLALHERKSSSKLKAQHRTSN